MRITNIFDAVRDGTYSDFRKFYTSDPNLFNKYAGMISDCRRAELSRASITNICAGS